jgi:threonine synthase
MGRGLSLSKCFTDSLFMQFKSTRGPNARATLSRAIARGIAPDGGLYVPESFPRFTASDFDSSLELPALADRLIGGFAQDDPLAAELPAICREAFNFPAPLVRLTGAPGPAHVLELFHGPTAAFKDFGARFLAASLERIRRAASRKLTILVATSGDTGGAVAAAFFKRPWVQVGVLYPKGLVSPRQAHQLACWGDNIQTFVVRGVFDECQRIVKEAFLDASLAASHELSSANSINIGRLLPQMVYYAQASLQIWRDTGAKASFIVPSGNVGNATACIFAKQAGMPIDEIVLATNANRTVTDFLQSGDYQARQSVATIANAMDVGNPSNMERLRTLFPEIDSIRGQVTSDSVTDEQIRARIRSDADTYGQVWCPHTAVAAEIYQRIAKVRAGKQWVIVATAHPSKFNDVVEPLIGRTLTMPTNLAKLLSLPKLETEISPTLDALRSELKP